MTSRDDILGAVRAHQPPAVGLPELRGPITRYEDRARQFATVLESVGGRCAFVDDVAALNKALAGLKEYASAQKVVSRVPGAGRANVDLAAVADPHDLADVDYAILPGVFGVAENGAVWTTDEGLPHRVVYYLVQHVALVVPAAEIVDTMHDAYARLSFAGPGFGCFISGPSKTADIEQALVIGAHGPRSLTVFCVGGQRPPERPGGEKASGVSTPVA